MREAESSEDKILAILETMKEGQKAKLLKVAQMVLPRATFDDILQPQDFPELEQNPLFRYEEGILTGIAMAQVALQDRDFYERF